MRHPFWSWTGCLALSLAGCVHGFDGRKTSTQSVSDQSSSAPLVVGPFRKTPEQFVPSSGKVASRGRRSAQANDTTRTALPKLDEINRPTTKLASRPANKLSTKSASNPAPVVRSDSQVVPVQFQPQKSSHEDPVYFPDDAPPIAKRSLPPLSPSSTTSTPTTASTANSPAEPAPFAEFDRAIPISSKSNRTPVIPASNKEPVFAPPAEDGTNVVQNGLSANGLSANERTTGDDAEPSDDGIQADSLPMIVPSQSAIQPSGPRELPSTATDLFQERASVVETSKSTASPRDVAVLVEQVFEDLRQRRLDDARERTEWLKRLVAKGADPTHPHQNSAIDSTANAPTTHSNDVTIPASREPKRLDVNDGKALNRHEAAAVKKVEQPGLSADDVPLSK